MVELSEAFKTVLVEGAKALRGAERRAFMARTVRALGAGGQRRAETELGWSRATIRKGEHEPASGIACHDNFAGRGRHRAEQRLPRLLDDIRDIVTGRSQADPRFRTLRLHARLTAEEARRQLVARMGCRDRDLPKPRSIRDKLGDLGFRPTKVLKCQPTKRSSRPTPSSRG